MGLTGAWGIEERGSRKVSVWSAISLFTHPFMSLRESMLTREIEDLNNKLTTKSDELNETMKRYSEVCMRWVVNAFKQSWMIFYLVQMTDPLLSLLHISVPPVYCFHHTWNSFLLHCQYWNESMPWCWTFMTLQFLHSLAVLRSSSQHCSLVSRSALSLVSLSISATSCCCSI